MLERKLTQSLVKRGEEKTLLVPLVKKEKTSKSRKCP
jgi:hypothetical protein